MEAIFKPEQLIAATNSPGMATALHYTSGQEEFDNRQCEGYMLKTDGVVGGHVLNSQKCFKYVDRPKRPRKSHSTNALIAVKPRQLSPVRLKLLLKQNSMRLKN